MGRPSKVSHVLGFLRIDAKPLAEHSPLLLLPIINPSSPHLYLTFINDELRDWWNLILFRSCSPPSSSLSLRRPNSPTYLPLLSRSARSFITAPRHPPFSQLVAQQQLHSTTSRARSIVPFIVDTSISNDIIFFSTIILLLFKPSSIGRQQRQQQQRYDRSNG